MSDFLCKQGHDMKPSDGPTCKKCGARVGTMDGMNEKQIKAQERAEMAQDSATEDNEGGEGEQ